jgi:hypothetical protein
MKRRDTWTGYALRRHSDAAWLSLRRCLSFQTRPMLTKSHARPYQTLATVRTLRIRMMIEQPGERIDIWRRDVAAGGMTWVAENAVRRQRLNDIVKAFAGYFVPPGSRGLWRGHAAHCLEGVEALMDRPHGEQMRYFIVLENAVLEYPVVAIPHRQLTRMVHCHQRANRYLVRSTADLAMLRLCEQFRPYLIYDFDTRSVQTFPTLVWSI